MGLRESMRLRIVDAMENTPTSLIPAPQPRDLVLEATRAYNDLVNSDGATPAAWDSVAADLEAAARLMAGDRVNFLLDRAHDARGNARYAKRMIAHARMVVAARGCIDTSAVTVERCPGCSGPAHASETDDDGYHLGCRPFASA